MPKSRKRKNADFQKVKLKVGKRLPKGGNETNISFKTRTIKVSQSIKDPSKTSNQPQTKGKLTLQVICSSFALWTAEYRVPLCCDTHDETDYDT